MTFGDWFNKNRPTIFMVGGIASMIGGTVASCWGTIKANKVINDTNIQVLALRTQRNQTEDAEKKELLKKEERKVIAKATAKVAGYYSIGVGLSGLGIAGICISHAQMQARLAMGASAYAALSTLVSRYQDILAEKGLTAEEEKMRLGVKEEREIEAKKVDISTGEITTVKEKIQILDPNLQGSPYAFYFDSTTSDDFVDVKDLDPDLAIDMSIRILQAKQAYLNDMLKAKNCGRAKVPIFMSDVLDALGMKHDGIPRYDEYGNITSYDTDLPRVCGWVYDPDNPSVSNYIDLRIKSVYVLDEHGGLKRTVILDPNVDGNVLGYEYVKGAK